MSAEMTKPRTKTQSQSEAAARKEASSAASTTLNRFARCREAHQTELEEDYVELIAELIATRGEARAVDISRALGVAQPTVAKTIGRLTRDGLVRTEPYRSIFLTEKGRAMATRARERHKIVRDFLCAIGVGPETAGIDAEGMEHHASDETLRVFARLTVELGRRRAK
jgi:DtxR family manganese transport transcriptional regulator